MSQYVGLCGVKCTPPLHSSLLPPPCRQIQRRASTGGGGSAVPPVDAPHLSLPRSHVVARLHAAASAAWLVARLAGAGAGEGHAVGGLQCKLMDVADECIRSAWRKVRGGEGSGAAQGE